MRPRSGVENFRRFVALALALVPLPLACSTPPRPAAVEPPPGPPPAASPTASPAASPAASTSAPLASAPAPADSLSVDPLPSSPACSADDECGWARCHPRAARCAFPCLSDRDCRLGARCLPAPGNADVRVCALGLNDL